MNKTNEMKHRDMSQKGTYDECKQHKPASSKKKKTTQFRGKLGPSWRPFLFSWQLGCQSMLLPGALEHTVCRALGLLRQEVPQTVFGSTERRTASLPGTWMATSTMAAATLRAG